MIGRRRARFVLAGVALGILLSALATVRAQAVLEPQPPPLTFITHAAFFSEETHRSPAVDPEVFVKNDAASEGTGPENIMHVAGLRPAQVDDIPELVVYNAAGDSLGLTLDKWLGASGTLEVGPGTTGGTRFTMTFKHLVAFGVYSLFRETFSRDGQTFVPIDGDGTENSFTASVEGGAIIVMTSPVLLSHTDAIVLVLHSDSQEHGISRGLIGINAHEQLIARMP